MIEKLEWIQSNTRQNIEQLQNLGAVNNSRTTALEPKTTTIRALSVPMCFKASNKRTPMQQNSLIMICRALLLFCHIFQ